jgi:hypothetical protein
VVVGQHQIQTALYLDARVVHHHGFAAHPAHAEDGHLRRVDDGRAEDVLPAVAAPVAEREGGAAQLVRTQAPLAGAVG